MNALKPTPTQKFEQRACPLCGEMFIDEHTVVPSPYINLAIQVYECQNAHSWVKHPGSLPAVSSGPPGNTHPFKPWRPPPSAKDIHATAFADKYRPFADSKELYKRH